MRRVAGLKPVSGIRGFIWASRRMDAQKLREVKNSLRWKVKEKISKLAPEEVESQCSSYVALSGLQS